MNSKFEDRANNTGVAAVKLRKQRPIPRNVISRFWMSVAIFFPLWFLKIPSGIWTMVYPKDVFARSFKEGIGTNLRYLMPEGTEIPLQPAAAALYEQRSESLGKGRPF